MQPEETGVELECDVSEGRSSDSNKVSEGICVGQRDEG